jgi:hypothetical protein
LAQGEWTGSDPAGPVKFFVLLADNEQPSGRAFFTYGISGMKFATECEPQGHKVPGQIGITQHRVRRSQHPRFSFHGHGVVIHGVITGSLGGPTISGTVQIDTPECDGDVMPFTTHSAH